MAYAGQRPGHSLSEQGFIEHSASHPLVLRARPPVRDPLAVDAVAGRLGISFYSAQHVAAGTKVFLDIPVRGAVHRFDGTVVFVREIPDAFEIGVWLDRAEDAERVRLVEEICLIERDQGITGEHLGSQPERPTPPFGTQTFGRFGRRAFSALSSALPRPLGRPAPHAHQ